jgi:hypothetical protein
LGLASSLQKARVNGALGGIIFWGSAMVMWPWPLYQLRSSAVKISLLPCFFDKSNKKRFFVSHQEEKYVEEHMVIWPNKQAEKRWK